MRVIEYKSYQYNRTFFRVQEMFKLSLTSPELRLRIIKGNGLEGLRKPPPPPIYPKFPEDKENVSMVECEQKRKYFLRNKFLYLTKIIFFRKYKYQSSDSITNEENSWSI